MNPPILWLAPDIITLDPAQPRAQALVTQGEWLMFVGTREEAQKRAGPQALVQNVPTGVVVPGFNDNHLHLVIFGDHSYAPDLTGLNERSIVETLKAFAETVPPGSPIVAYAWDFPACSHPRKELLDEAFPDRPVALAQFGGHALWVNSVVLRSMGIDRYHSPAQGLVLRDDQGEPTGILREVIPNPISDQHFREIFFKKALRDPRIRRSLEVFRRHGITSVQDNSWYAPVLSTLRKLHRSGELTARVSCWALGRDLKARAALDRSATVQDWVTRGPHKEFLDGTFTTRTAWMSEPYPGFPNDNGLGFDPRWLQKILKKLIGERRQGAFHSIGDRSTSTFLDVWEGLVQDHPEAVALRMRLEHVQALQRSDLARLKALGVCVAAQPPALADPTKDISILGRDRALACYPHRSLLDAGVPLSFGSDVPGESFCDPLRGIDLVCNREGPERIEPLEALAAYTTGSAFVEFQESYKGTLKAGFLADFAVLSDDPTSVDRAALKDLIVERTVVGARTVWDRSFEV